MSWCSRLLFGFFIFNFSLHTSSRELVLPESLSEWKDWVVYDHPDIQCPFLYNNGTRHCQWITALTLKASAKHLSFRQQVSTFTDTWITLPGNDIYWPTGVHAGPKILPVRQLNGTPQVYLGPGKYTIEGKIPWKSIPQSLQIPAQTGLITLRVNDASIEQIDIDKQHRLWLGNNQSKTKKVENDSVKISVFRHIKDSVPLELSTKLILDVSGSEREVVIGQALLNNFAPLLLTSHLPARVEPDGQLRIQVKPGHWEVTLNARHRGPVNKLSYTALSALWPQQEIWVFNAQRHLRSVQVTGAESIDPKQTDLPTHWQQLPAFLMTPQNTLELVQQHRGDPNPIANKLELQQDIWLDFSGDGYTLRDQIQGEMHQGWRLNSQADYALGRVEIDGEPQLITQLETGIVGVEIRQSTLNMTALSRHSRSADLFASGWQTDFQSARSVLHLPPGWSLFSATGADQIRYSWISRWSLWDIFLVLIIAAAVNQLCGRASGLLALITLVITYQRSQAPLFIWLNIVAVLALMPAVSGRFKKWLSYYQHLSFIVLVLIVLPFAVNQIRQAIYPQLEKPTHRAYQQEDQSRTTNIERGISEQQDRRTDEHDDDNTVTRERLAQEKETLMAGRFIEETPIATPKPRRKMDFLQSAPSAIGAFSGGKVPESKQYRRERNVQNVQTGPSIPAWRWKQVNLHWNGPVKAAEKIKLRLIPPGINRLGNLLGVALVLLLALRLIWQANPSIPLPPRLKQSWLKHFAPLQGWMLVTFLSLLTGFNLLGAPAAKADIIIDNELLKTLEKRLTQPAECLPACAAIESLNLSIKGHRLQLTLIVNALEQIAMPLPVPQRNWQPQSITLDGATTALSYHRQQLLAVIEPGKHTLLIAGSLRHLDQLTLPLSAPAHNVSTLAPGWSVAGIRDGFSAHSLQLSRNSRQGEEKSLRLLPDPLPDFVTVHRQLYLGIDWIVETQVRRITPQQGAISLTIPLLSGESLTSDHIKTNKQGVIVNFAPQQRQVSWRSVLAKAERLTLTAADQHQWAEIWSVDTSPRWHTEASGLAPIKPSEGARRQIPQWRPWPGESITLAITEPTAIDGHHVSIDSAELIHDLGQRSNTTRLQFSVRSSLGKNMIFNLPDAAQLQDFTIDGASQPITQETGAIKIPLHPGAQEIALDWRTGEGISTYLTSPALSFPSASSNTRINISLPRDRWPLLVGGPAVGPAVLYWGWLLVITIVAAVLGRSTITPLKTHHWLLIGLGMSTTNLYTPVVIVLWFFAMAKRGQLEHLPSPSAFKWMQFGLFALSLLALAMLVGTIPYGLLASPDMHILGNGSSAYNLHWYQDRSADILPQAWVVSLPMWCYRLAMLAWSLWLVFALLGWIRWAWAQISNRGLWHLST